MRSLVSRLKSIRLGQVLGIFLAGCFLLLSTACSGNAQGKSPSSVNDPAKAYSVKNAPESGANSYSDIDPRRDTSGTAARAKALSDRSERNVRRRSGDPVENVKRAANEGAENLKEIDRKAKRAVRNLPENTQDTLEEASDRAASQVKKVRRNLEQAADSVQESAREIVR